MKEQQKPFAVRRANITTLFKDSLSAYKYHMATLGSVMLKRNSSGRMVQVY